MRKKMTVFIVTVNLWEATETLGVFSTSLKAEAFVATLRESDRINSEISDFEITDFVVV